MKNELREINSMMQENTKNSKLEHKIKKMLGNFFKSKLIALEEQKEGYTRYNNKIDKIKLELLENKDEIIDNEIIPILKNDFCYKSLEELLDLVDDFYLSEYKKQVRYYDELNKLKQDDNIKTLEKELYKIFKWSFYNSNLDAKSTIAYIGNIKYKQEIKQGLKDKKYDLTNFEKAYNKAYIRFKKDFNNYDDFREDAKEDAKEDDIGFGWKLYGTIKVIEGLFKL